MLSVAAVQKTKGNCNPTTHTHIYEMSFSHIYHVRALFLFLRTSSRRTHHCASFHSALHHWQSPHRMCLILCASSPSIDGTCLGVLSRKRGKEEVELGWIDDVCPGEGSRYRRVEICFGGQEFSSQNCAQTQPLESWSEGWKPLLRWFGIKFCHIGW